MNFANSDEKEISMNNPANDETNQEAGDDGGHDPCRSRGHHGSVRLWFWSQARKIVVAVIGTTVLLAGLAMLLLPGPGWAAIFAGLAILASEFVWARWVLKHARAKFNQAWEMATGSKLLSEDDKDDEPEAKPSRTSAPTP
jgi:hypothetical protein